MSITPEQVKSARKLLGWSQADLAGHLGESEVTIGEFETSGRLRLTARLAALRDIFETAGVEFTDKSVELNAKVIRATRDPPSKR